MVAETQSIQTPYPRNKLADAMEIATILAAERGMEIFFAEDADLDHFFAPQMGEHSGLYCRSLFRKKGMFVVGHAHRYADMGIVLHGKLRVYCDGKVSDIEGPSKPFVSEAGSRKVTVALEDTTLLTFHPTNETDLEKIEQDIFIQSEFYRRYEAHRRLTDPTFNVPGKQKTKEIQ